MRASFRLTALVVACWLISGLAPGAAMAAPADHDPLERVNRRIFWFNDEVDTHILVPVARGWDAVAPAPVKRSVEHFFQNLDFPIVAANDLLQAKFVHATSDVGRFVVNTTVGVLGFFDPASGWGLQAHDEDFGQTLGYWGIPPGPYLVLPFFGPSDPRDAVGLGADSFSMVYPYFLALAYTVSAGGVRVTNERAATLQEVRQLKEASVDYYAAVRNAYRQRRDALVHDRTEPSAAEQQNLYNLDSDGE